MSEQIECDGCGRSFITDDPHGMLAAITGPCPSCGGRFRLVEPVGALTSQDAPQQHPHWHPHPSR